jgi:hypothetical protein
MDTAGARLLRTRLTDAYEFATQVAYAKPEQIWATVLACAITHNIHCFTTAPRLLYNSTEGSSGKTTLGIHIPRMLAFQPFDLTLATEPSIMAKFLAGEVTGLFDEVGHLFGAAGTGGRTSQKYTILNTGYEWTAVASFSNNRVATDVHIYGVVFMTGLHTSVPPDLLRRCVRIVMKPAPERIAGGLLDALDWDTQYIGRDLGKALHQAVRGQSADIADAFRNRLRGLHPQLTSRMRQIWGPLFAVSLAAGGDMPDICLTAFREIALDASGRPHIPVKDGILLEAARLMQEIGGDECFLPARDLRIYLAEAGTVEGLERMSDNALGRLMTQALGGPAVQHTSLWHYPLEDGSKDTEKHNMRGWWMTENILKAKQLEESLAPPAEAEPPDEYANLFD